MTNYGFHTAMSEAGIEIASTAVGDRYVLDELRRRGWSLGGEQSGPHHQPALRPLGRRNRQRAAHDARRSASAICASAGAMHKLPQRLVNIRAADRTTLNAAIGDGRPGGDRALRRGAAGPRARARARLRHRAAIRVMVEAPSDDGADGVCGRSAAIERVVELRA